MFMDEAHFIGGGGGVVVGWGSVFVSRAQHGALVQFPEPLYDRVRII